MRKLDSATIEAAYQYLDFGSSLNSKIKKLSLGMKQQKCYSISY
ncbi:hypothetical protein [Thomasclavelia ramosa]|nr:hypothetical protein [Thomasclavelia ramosa]